MTISTDNASFTLKYIEARVRSEGWRKNSIPWTVHDLSHDLL